MLVHIIRHGTASHLLENYRRKVNYEEICTLLHDWGTSSLTEVGREEINKVYENMVANYSHLYYSPLKRTRQSAKPFAKHPDILTSEEMPGLAEIFILPPFLPKRIKLSIGTWVYLCVFKSFYTLKVVTYLKEARNILKIVAESKKDSLLVSHQARIITIMLYCFFSFKWKVLRVNVKPAGISIVKKVK